MIFYKYYSIRINESQFIYRAKPMRFLLFCIVLLKYYILLEIQF
nr:MAG TPA: hypothetical protein [Bacteriophage sp.]